MAGVMQQIWNSKSATDHGHIYGRAALPTEERGTSGGGNCLDGVSAVLRGNQAVRDVTSCRYGSADSSALAGYGLSLSPLVAVS